MRDSEPVVVVDLAPDRVPQRVLVVEPPEVVAVGEAVVGELGAEQLRVAGVLVFERGVAVRGFAGGHGLARVPGDGAGPALCASGLRPRSHSAVATTPTAAVITMDTSAGAR